MRDLDQNFHPQYFAMPQMQDYQALCSQDGGHITLKDDMLNKWYIQDIILIILLFLLFPVVRNVKIPLAIIYFLAGEFRLQLALSSNPAYVNTCICSS